MKMILAVTGLFAAISAFAGESGFVYQGQTYVVYKDGAKVGKTATELGYVPTKSGRKISSMGNQTNFNEVVVDYQDDGVARCYYGLAGISTSNIFCVKK